MKFQKFILSCFGIGFIPVAPGTFGSILPVAAFLAVHYFWPMRFISIFFLLAAMVISSFLCLFYAGRIEKMGDEKDPGWIVIDEFAGQAVALFPAAVTSGNVLIPAIAAFVLFRIFDIFKPSPIREMEHIDGGFGILADDLVAGVIAGTVICIVTYLARLAQLSG